MPGTQLRLRDERNFNADHWSRRGAASAALLSQESEIREGSPPDRLPGAIQRRPTYEISADSFLLRVPNGLVLHYRKGEGVTASRPADVAASDIPLFLKGSVYGAIAWINGFIPLHASAVVHDGAVHALSAPSGYGKSTLAAALGARGLTLFADDVLVLDLSDPSRIICLPGHKQLKLWDDAIALTGTERGEAVRKNLRKYYAASPYAAAGNPLPLGQITFLRSQARHPEPPVAMKGADRLGFLLSAFYRRHFCAAIIDHRSTFSALARIGASVPMSVFDRPFDKTVFEQGVDLMTRAIRNEQDA